MFSYRHAFHAGNHADVLKHVVLVQLLRYLTQKEKPLWYIDTHAGAAAYALDAGHAATSTEFQSGIARLWHRDDLPPAVAEYVAEVRAQNADGALHRYPGSPQLALQLLRAQDRLRLFELHTTDARLLEAYFRDGGTRAIARKEDGFAALQGLLPPPSRRALVLIDPPYEDKDDYRRVMVALREAKKRFATGVYCLWYPQVQRPESRRFPTLLKGLQPKDWLHASLKVKAPTADGFGLHGSGVFVLNPPWSLPDVLRSALPFLARELAQDASAGFELEFELA